MPTWLTNHDYRLHPSNDMLQQFIAGKCMMQSFDKELGLVDCYDDIYQNTGAE